MGNYIVYGGKRQRKLKKPSEYKNLDAHLADKLIYFCPECRNCWEVNKKKWSTAVLFYDDFVSYGKKREVCLRCK